LSRNLTNGLGTFLRSPGESSIVRYLV